MEWVLLVVAQTARMRKANCEKKIVLSVNIHCQKCSTEVLKSATKLTGIDHISVDAEKGIVTVIGDVDPVCVTTQIRKTGKRVEIISVGPPPKPPEPGKEKKAS